MVLKKKRKTPGNDNISHVIGQDWQVEIQIPKSTVASQNTRQIMLYRR